MLRNEHIVATYTIFWKFPTVTERAAIVPIEAERAALLALIT